MRRRTYRLIVSIMLPTLLLGVLWLPLPSWGLTLEEAKTQGVVGEQPDGYLGVVQPGASAEVQALVNDVNQKRRHMYEDIARRNSTKLEAVEMLAGKTAIDNTRSGNFIRSPSGQWVKK
ncbi:MAG TPA: YdbL family protein [Candidatus Saccharimonadia bacterium]|nr:YdbL family protein [Candidatus Saccharimonadia bacterium]